MYLAYCQRWTNGHSTHRTIGEAHEAAANTAHGTPVGEPFVCGLDEVGFAAIPEGGLKVEYPNS